MEKIFTIELIKETGYTSWHKFYNSVHSTNVFNNTITYAYKSPNGENNEIILPIPQHILEGLSLEESRTLLKLVKIESFAALFEKIKSEGKHYNILYWYDVIVRDEKDQISYVRLEFNIRMVERLAAIEKLDLQYLLYTKERVEK